jgi:BMFP domain-containing protein YqiC
MRNNLIERLNFNGFNWKENVLHRTRRWTVERAEAAARIAELEAALRSILEIPNSDAAQGIMKVLAHCALEANT